MNKLIVDETRPITLVGGGELEPQDLKWALSLAPCLVAADGGAAHALAQNHVPKAVIGDFDSISPEIRDQIPADHLFHIAEQDSTDFDKALRSIRAPLVLAVGFLGGRLDHQLAVLNTLVQDLGPACILIGRHEVIFHLPQEISLPLVPGDIVSLFPLRQVQACSDGLEWPLAGLWMQPGGQIGTSNRALGPVTLRVEGPGLLGMVPRRYLAELMSALVRQ